MAQWLTNPTRNREVAGLIPGLAQWVKDLVAVSYGVGHRHGSDLALLWLWRRPVATAPIRPLTIRRCRELWCRLQTRLGSSVAVALV